MFPIGRPEIMNLLRTDQQELKDLLRGIHKWSRSEQSDVSGTWHIHSPERIDDRNWTRSSDLD